MNDGQINPELTGGGHSRDPSRLPGLRPIGPGCRCRLPHRVYLLPVTFLANWLPYLHGGSRYRCSGLIALGQADGMDHRAPAPPPGKIARAGSPQPAAPIPEPARPARACP
jgi:hypothetical protein